MIQLTYSLEATTQDQTTGETAVSSALRVLEFDAVTSVSHEAGAALTEKAVEGGVTSDHKSPSPRRISVEAWVSNVPLGAPPPGGLDATVSADVTSQPETDANVIGFSEAFDRVRGVFNELHRLAREPVAISLSTPVQDYEDVQLVSVTTPTDQETGTDAARFSLEFQEVNVVETRDTATPIPREPRGAGAGSNGAQEGAEGDGSGAEAEASDLHDLLSNIGINV